MTKTSGWPGIVRSGSTRTRPARSSGTPSDRASGEAATPAAQSTVRAAIRSAPMPTPLGVDRRHRPARSGPRRPGRSSCSPRLLRERRRRSAGRTRGRPFEQDHVRLRRVDVPEVAAPGRAARSRAGRRPARRRSARRRRSRTSARRAAAPGRARARRPRRRRARGGGSPGRPRCSSGPGAYGAHSSWPKYECVAPVATIR